MAHQEPVLENKRFGLYLRQIRENRKLSLDNVEEMTAGYPERVTKSHLSRIENGQAVPTFPRMFALSQIYGVPISSIAEKFEIDLRREMQPSATITKSQQELRDEARALRMTGRYADALVLYEVLIDRWQAEAVEPFALPPAAGSNGNAVSVNDGGAAEVRHAAAAIHDNQLFDLRREKINCLLHLARYTTAKEESENLHNNSRLTRMQRAAILQLFATACYRLGKFSMALIALERAEFELQETEEAADPPSAFESAESPASLDPAESETALRELTVQLAALKGNLLALTGDSNSAIEAYEVAAAGYSELGVPFEACRCRLNLTSALIDVGQNRLARKHLSEIVQEAERQRYDRQFALALSNLALLAFREGDFATAETYCIRSNSVARPRDYTSVVFRNCYYLWSIAREREEASAIRTNERTLRTYLSRVESYLPEAEMYRAFISGGEA